MLYSYTAPPFVILRLSIRPRGRFTNRVSIYIYIYIYIYIRRSDLGVALCPIAPYIYLFSLLLSGTSCRTFYDSARQLRGVSLYVDTRGEFALPARDYRVAAGVRPGFGFDRSSVFGPEDRRTLHLRSSAPKHGSKIGRKTARGVGLLRRWGILRT